ncbi:hypothetical protein LPN04_27205 [Rugamonas sp. A1-17]|nr:hypothetical protein [Rugamonas sp. A1-17]
MDLDYTSEHIDKLQVQTGPAVAADGFELGIGASFVQHHIEVMVQTATIFDFDRSRIRDQGYVPMFNHVFQ